jgi:D-proline reductase (dithiol) PrdB
MSLSKVYGLQSEIFVPITPKSVFTRPTKPLSEMTIGLATAAGVHCKSDKRFNLSGDTTYRVVPDDTPSSELMVTHGGYDNKDVNRDINCMFPIDRLHELVKEGFIGGSAKNHYTAMGGGGDIKVFTESTGPEIAQHFKEEGVDGVVMTAG